LVGIERTTTLVDTGAYRYIRHPIYSAFLLGGAGVLLKDVSWSGTLLTLFVFAGAVVAAKTEERENIEFFGEAYRDYMKRTRMFFPFLV
jgi:protein-S-isoprenylcysteine O-methyltransferase Ste14